MTNIVNSIFEMPTKYQCKLSTYRGDFKNLVLLLLFCFHCERWCENKRAVQFNKISGEQILV